MGVCNCEYCDKSAVAFATVPDSRLRGIHPGECGYREKPLCSLHAAILRRDGGNTERIRCLHVRLNCDGYCFDCGELCPTS